MGVLICILFITVIHIIKPVDIFLKVKLPDSQMKLKVAALILARGGSKGIYKKNLSLIQNKTLISRTVETLTEFGKFDSVWVSTDDADIASESMKSGAQVYRRSHKFSTDDAPSILAVQEFVSSKRDDVDVVALVQCTSPFLQTQDLDKAYRLIVHVGYDSVFSVTRNYKLLWKINSDDGSIFPFNFNASDRPRRQTKLDELTEAGMFYFAKTSVIDQGVLQGGKIGYVEVPKDRALEIDTINDLHIARILSSLIMQ